MAKILERRHVEGGIGGGHWEDRIRVLDAGEKPPKDSVSVDDDTPERDWESARVHPEGE